VTTGRAALLAAPKSRLPPVSATVDAPVLEAVPLSCSEFRLKLPALLLAVNVPAAAVWLPRNCSAAFDPLEGATAPAQLAAVAQDWVAPAVVLVQLVVGSEG
jgi:hypothetical protein